jgi:hypothetical protein
MAFSFGNKIITDGLILYLDASNPVSYPGSGNTWRDLSTKGNNFALINSPTYQNSSLRFNLDGTINQYATCSNNIFGDFDKGDFTIEYVANFPFNNGPFSAVLSNNHGAYHSTGSAGAAGYSLGIVNQTYFQDNGYRANSNSEQFAADTTNMPLKDRITHQAYTIQRGPSNVDTVTGKLYKTGSLTTTITYDMGPTRFATDGRNPLGNSNISNTIYTLTMMRAAGNSYYASGSLYQIRVYNRVLSAAEITQNYITAKSKFRI